MDAFSAEEVETVTIKKSARIGYTKIIGHVVGYHIHQDPCSMLIVQPTIDDAEGYSKEELQPTIDETLVLRQKVGDSKSRSSGNTIAKKKYPGGILHIIGANSPRGFRRITVRLVFFDECSGYPPAAGLEGDQIKLGTKRTETFWNRKIGIGSTPTVKGACRVSNSFDKSDKGYFFLTCPYCEGKHIRLFREPKEPIILRGEKVKAACLQWVDNDPRTAGWACPDCGSLIDYSLHHKMVSAGEWIGETWGWTADDGFKFQDNFTGHIGFWLWAGYSYSPNSTPAKLAAEFLDSKGDTETRKTFWNTVLGLEWEEEGEAANEHSLMARRETFVAEVPGPVLCLTAGVDIQDDRIELEIVGWQQSQESFSVDYVILPGSTSLPDVWEKLEEALKVTYEKEDGQRLRVMATCIDSGFRPKAVYDFVLKMKNPHIWPTKGMATEGRPIVETMTARARRLRRKRSKKASPELIGTHEAKLLLMRRLQLPAPGPGYCHFPAERDEEYFKQLTAEQLVTKYVNTRPVNEFHLKRPRNEALDCRILAHAALLLADPKWPTLTSEPPPQKRKTKPPTSQPQTATPKHKGTLIR